MDSDQLTADLCPDLDGTRGSYNAVGIYRYHQIAGPDITRVDAERLFLFFRRFAVTRRISRGFIRRFCAVGRILFRGSLAATSYETRGDQTENKDQTNLVLKSGKHSLPL